MWLSVYKGKGEALKRGNYSGLWLIDQTMEVVEVVEENMIREKLDTTSVQS